MKIAKGQKLDKGPHFLALSWTHSKGDTKCIAAESAKRVGIPPLIVVVDIGQVPRAPAIVTLGLLMGAIPARFGSDGQ